MSNNEQVDEVDEVDVGDIDLDEEIEEEPSLDLGVAFTPRQILGGFVLLAALILLLRRRLRGRSPDD